MMVKIDAGGQEMCRPRPKGGGCLIFLDYFYGVESRGFG